MGHPIDIPRSWHHTIAPGGFWIDYELGHVWSYHSGSQKWRCIGRGVKRGYRSIVVPRGEPLGHGGTQQCLHRYLYSRFHSVPLDQLDVIDHMDRDSTNNRIDNLRHCDTLTNNRNKDIWIAGINQGPPIPVHSSEIAVMIARYIQ